MPDRHGTHTVERGISLPNVCRDWNCPGPKFRNGSSDDTGRTLTCETWYLWIGYYNILVRIHCSTADPVSGSRDVGWFVIPTRGWLPLKPQRSLEYSLKIIQYFNNFKYQSGLGWRKIQSSRGCQNWFVPCCLQLDDPGTTVLRCQKHSSSVPRAIIITSTSRERHALVIAPQNARDLGRCSRTNPTHTHTNSAGDCPIVLPVRLPFPSRL